MPQITLHIERVLDILTGLPQVNCTLKDLLDLDCPRLIELRHVMPLVDRRFVMGVLSS